MAIGFVGAGIRPRQFFVPWKHPLIALDRTGGLELGDLVHQEGAGEPKNRGHGLRIAFLGGKERMIQDHLGEAIGARLHGQNPAGWASQLPR